MSEEKTITTLLGGTTKLPQDGSLFYKYLTLQLQRMDSTGARKIGPGAATLLGRVQEPSFSSATAAATASIAAAALPDGIATVLAAAAIRHVLSDSRIQKIISSFDQASEATRSEIADSVVDFPSMPDDVAALLRGFYPAASAQPSGPPVQRIFPKGIEPEGVGTPVFTTNAPAAAVSAAVSAAVAEPAFSEGQTLKTYTLFMWLVLVALCNLLASWNDMREGLADLNARLPQTETLSELRRSIRQHLAGKPGDFRLVKGRNVNLRQSPSMRAEVLMQLSEGDLVAVLGKEDRTWLNVSYEKDGVLIEGYISTKHLKRTR